jgi:hypothetical protein
VKIELGMSSQTAKRVLKWAIILGLLQVAMAVVNTIILLEPGGTEFKPEVLDNFPLFFIFLFAVNFTVTFLILFFALKEILRIQPTENKWVVAISIQFLGGFLINGAIMSLIVGRLIRPGGIPVQLLAMVLAALLVKEQKATRK